MVYYSQTDPKWASFQYGTAKMASSGCGPTSAAMVVSSLTDLTVTPKEMAQYSLSIGARIPNVGTNGYLLHPSVARKYGLICIQTESIDKAIKCIKAGGMVVCSTPGGVTGLFSTGGHQFCMVGAKGDTLEFYDPYLYAGKYNSKYRKNKATVRGNSVFVSKQNAKPEIVAFWCFYKPEEIKAPEPVKETVQQEEEEMTQEKFNEMMNNYIGNIIGAMEPSDWSAEDREWAEGNGIIKGDDKGWMHYKSFVTREEAVAMLSRLYNLLTGNK